MLSLMQFQGQWRDYQKRVLDELQDHLEDTKLHIVAAPGSGKTVLGLEVMRELGKPTLILSPTLTIRNQWTERLFEMFFTQSEMDHVDLSYDLKNPRTMTSVTYQALHALWKFETQEEGEKLRRPDFERLIELLNTETGVTIIVDEAHHLRREWWRALNALIDALPNATLVALTATPPYDASYAEWSRYDDLCGAIDAEISVPELVRNGDLCPHQDFVHFSLPQRSEIELLGDRRRGIAALISDFLSDGGFIEALASHPWMTSPELHEEAILGDPGLLSSMLILMAAAEKELPSAPLELLGVGNENIPLLTPVWLQVFLNGFVFDQTGLFSEVEGERKQIERRLRKLGLVEGKRVKLLESRKAIKAMAGSLAKLDSIIEIAAEEHKNLEDQLRMVVLTDYVRASDLPRQNDQPFSPTKLGVVPIFEALRRAKLQERRIGVLTGTLVIIPETARSVLSEAAEAAQVSDTEIKLKPLPGCPGYCQFQLGGNSNQKTVRLVTHLFNLGSIRVLVGTQALLGEGWDAPTINTLVLASNVGSYMLSNQMRGRAIRIDSAVPNKVSNIWHLATVEPQSSQLWPTSVSRFVWNTVVGPYEFEMQKLGSDMRLLFQRFQMFEGISNGDTDHISNGIGRLDISSQGWEEGQIGSKNDHMFGHARLRSTITQKWISSLGDSHQRSHVHKIAEANYAPRGGSYDQTLQFLSINAVLGGFTSAAGALRQYQSVREIATLALIFGGLTLVYSVPKLYLSARLFFKNGTLERSLRQVCQVLLKGLDHVGALKSHPSAYSVEIEPSIRGFHNIILHGASRAEERVFLDALSEILGPIENPRYILVRKSWLGWIKRKDYHAVPTILGTHKDDAEYFAYCWNKKIGPVKRVFTRQREGRKTLLRARASSMAAGFQRFVDRRSQWR
ncbi:MAG: DEAD/DEAH box helicase family protein [Parasphingorhabdus sp.]